MSRRHEGHIRERSPGSFEIRYTLPPDPWTGKRKVVTTTFRGQRREAMAELRRRLRSIDTSEHVDPSRVTVGQWLDTWLTSILEEVSPKTHERYAEVVRNYLRPRFGVLQLAKLTPPHIQAAYTEWAEGGRLDGRPGGLSPQTRRHMHRILRAALLRAVEQQLIARNPADAFRKRLPKVERREMVALTVDQAQTLLAALRHTRTYWPALVALATGMRRGEILALRWRNVDLDRGIVRVTGSLEQTKAGLRFKAPKTNRSRAITLPAFAVEELRRLKREQAETFLALGMRPNLDTLVCCREDGEPLQPRSLTHEFTRLVARAKGVPRVRFHDLRHSHATQLLADGVHPKVAQERLGHSTIATTLDLYSHVTSTMQEDAASRLDAAYKSALKSPAGGA
ncbi:MAG TPA: site-specific integrase [Stellaceae bacterium]|nr:site-specific integrase [Stellaceae bacterium]